MSGRNPQLKQVIEKAQHYAFERQYPEGYGWGELSSNATMEAEQIFQYYYLGMKDHPDIIKLAKQILKTQNTDGTWNIYFDAPGDLSTTVECYFALKLGHDTQSPSMVLARDFILSLTSQQADGGWGGIQPATVYSLIALKNLGYDTHYEIFTRCFKGIKNSFTFETPTRIKIQPTNSPVWDTCLMMNGLLEYGVNSDDINIQKAARWLISEQIKSSGDWQIKNPKTPTGGWAFEFANNYFPDIDDTAEVLLALNRCHMTDSEEEKLRLQAIQSGAEWMLSMQCSNGGWAGFDIDCTNYFLSNMAFFDFGNILDAPCVDITAHVLEALINLGYSSSLTEIKKAIKFIYSQQEEDGFWLGTWGVNYLYGTAATLVSLQKIGEDLTQPRLQKAISWLLEKQNPDGGWGESCASYADKKQAGNGFSTASQTAWVLLALLYCGKANSKTVTDGINYLCNTQLTNGTWDEKYYTGTGTVGNLVKNQGTELSAAILRVL